MGKNTSDHYDTKFYSILQDGMGNSAKNVLSILYKYYKPESVVDIGCGLGVWLAEAESLGSSKLKGFDGSWVNENTLKSKNIDFTAVNFDKAVPKIDEKYDLCISVEVAEHISEINAKSFIEALCSASDVVLFSAAIKYQGGTNHINEQWQSYWIDMFKSNGYECFDVLRTQLWADESVAWWYRQNVFLFTRKNNGLINNDLLKAAEKPVYDIVHPKNYEGKLRYRNHLSDPTLKFCLLSAKQYIANKIRRIIKRRS